MVRPEDGGRLLFPESSKAAVLLGQAGSRELVELDIPVFEASNGSVGISTEYLGQIASTVEEGSILWVQPNITNLELQGQSNPEDQGRTESLFADGNVKVDHRNKCLFVDKSLAHLQPKAFSVLELFSLNAGQLLSRDQVLLGVWGDTWRHRRAVDEYVKQIRSALGDYRELLQTRQRRGYVLVDGETAAE